MIDLRLLVAIGVAVAAPASVAKWAWPPRTLRFKVQDAAWMGIGAGALVARITALAIDDPMSFVSLRQFLQIRSGMEFWPGLAAAMAVWSFEARGEWVDASDRLADLAPFALVSYGVFELSCLWRDGCFGPVSPLGLAPGGSGPAELPIGVIVGLGAIGLAVIVRTRHGGRADTVLLAVGGLALLRGVASFWLPSVSAGVTRPHLESLVVATVAAAALATRGGSRLRARASPAQGRDR